MSSNIPFSPESLSFEQGPDTVSKAPVVEPAEAPAEAPAAQPVAAISDEVTRAAEVANGAVIEAPIEAFEREISRCLKDLNGNNLQRLMINGTRDEMLRQLAHVAFQKLFHTEEDVSLLTLSPMLKELSREDKNMFWAYLTRLVDADQYPQTTQELN